MARPVFVCKVPEQWKKRAKAGLCPVCGKTRLEFEKGRRVYCSEKCSDEYSKQYISWNGLREKILKERGEKCKKCGIDKEGIDKINKERNEEVYERFIKENKEMLEQFMNRELFELDKEFKEKFDELMDDRKLANKIKWELDEDLKKKYNFYPALKTNYFEVDHVKAVVNGGDMWDEDNLQVLCGDCHKEKTRQDMLERKRRKIKTKKL